MWLVILNNAHYAPHGASMTVTTICIADCWLAEVGWQRLAGKDHCTLKVNEIKIASLGKKFKGKMSNDLDRLIVLKW